MINLMLKEILTHIGGTIEQGNDNIVIQQVVTRPNLLRNNTLLFCRENKVNVDWNSCRDYCSCAVISTKGKIPGVPGDNVTMISVPDVDYAYWKFIKYYRGLFKIPVIGITGTCGKTTTKEMIKSMLARKYNVHSTYKSENARRLNLHYLLGINEHTQAAVFEMGVGFPGNVRDSCNYFQPGIGIITNIGVDHLFGCKTLEKYIQAKAEILEGLAFSGTLILNSDDATTNKLDLAPYQGTVILFGFGEKAHYRALSAKYVQGGMEFSMQNQGNVYEAFVPGYGEHNVYNALAAIAAVHQIGLEIKEAVESLRYFQHINRHLQTFEGIKGSTVIDDTWSSNPTSMSAALDVLNGFAKNRKTIAVLGKMGLLGDLSAEKHSEMGKKVVANGIDILITVGSEAQNIGRSALANGMKESDIIDCVNAGEVFDVLNQVLDTDSVVLVKNSMEMSFSDLMKRIIVK